jgi:hypothetical protein
MKFFRPLKSQHWVTVGSHALEEAKLNATANIRHPVGVVFLWVLAYVERTSG